MKISYRDGTLLADNNFSLYFYHFICQDIIENNLPCRTVKQAIEAGLLPEFSGYEYYINEL